MNFKLLLVLLSSIAAPLLGHGFVGKTLVKTPTGYTEIRYLKQNDFVISYDYEGHCVPRRILSKNINYGNACVMLKIEHCMLEVAPDHKFYDREHYEFIEARHVREMDTVLLSNCIHPVYSSFKSIDKSIFEDGFEFYDLTIDEYHNYCVTTEDILVHNQFYMAMGAQYGGRAMGYAIGNPYGGWGNKPAHFAEFEERVNKKAAAGSNSPMDDPDDWGWDWKYSERERKEFEKAAKSHDQRAQEHREKLQQYKDNPDAYDNKGHLKNAAGHPERRAKIINTRIVHLNGEITEQTKQAAEARAKANERVLRRRRR